MPLSSTKTRPWIRFSLLGLGLFLSLLISWWGYSLYLLHQQVLLYQVQTGGIDLSQLEALKNEKLWMIISEGLTIGLTFFGALYWIDRSMMRDLNRSEDLKSLLAIWTHECKTPIASIQLQAETLLLENDQSLSSLQKKYLERIVGDCHRLGSFVERILQLARSQAFSLHLTPGKINEDIQIWWETEGKILYSNKINLTLHSKPNVWALREPEALNHILSNLIENGCKYNQTQEMKIDIDFEGRKPRVRISNLESPFPKESLRRLGNLFFRIGKPGIPGSGIGLFLVKRLMKKMNGDALFYNQNSESIIELIFRPTHAIEETV